MSMETEMNLVEEVRETGEMTKQAKALFVRLWKAEYQAVTRQNKAESDLHMAQILGKPCARFEAIIARANTKIAEVTIEIRSNVIYGQFPADADVTCREKLAELEGYVADCYHCICEDARWVVGRHDR
ncbi:MAG: hypothetical protein ACRC1W_12810 [Shewanella sp.]